MSFVSLAHISDRPGQYGDDQRQMGRRPPRRVPSCAFEASPSVIIGTEDQEI